MSLTSRPVSNRPRFISLPPPCGVRLSDRPGAGEGRARRAARAGYHMPPTLAAMPSAWVIAAETRVPGAVWGSISRKPGHRVGFLRRCRTATVFRSRRRIRVAVNSNDYPPPHVHAFGAGREARFRLNCPDGPVELWDYEGRWTMADLNELGGKIAHQLDQCCRTWSEIHG